MTGDEHIEGRTARVNRTGDGQPLGIAVFLGADDLRKLGVELHTTDAVAYQVEAGDLRFTPVHRPRGDRQ